MALSLASSRPLASLRPVRGLARPRSRAAAAPCRSLRAGRAVCRLGNEKRSAGKDRGVQNKAVSGREAGSMDDETDEGGGAAPKEEEYDIYRDSLLRYMGYANECGEALSAWLPPYGVPLSYAIAISYVLADTAHKGKKSWNGTSCAEEDEYCVDDGIRVVHASRHVIDTLVWQLLASVFIPGATIHICVAGAAAFLQSVAGPGLAGVGHEDIALLLTDGGIVSKSIPTFLGLGFIPFIVHPIDDAVHKAMDMTSRPAMQDALCGHFGGEAANLDECVMEEPQFPLEARQPRAVQAAVAAAAVLYAPLAFHLSEGLFGR